MRHQPLEMHSVTSTRSPGVRTSRTLNEVPGPLRTLRAVVEVAGAANALAEEARTAMAARVWINVFLDKVIIMMVPLEVV